MNDTLINFKTDKKIKIQAQKIAGRMGLNLSDVLNIYLQSFIRKKELYISLNEDESNPSKELLVALKSAEAEIKSGKTRGFKNLDKAIAFLESL